MKSKLLVLALSMFAMSFVAANDPVATNAPVENSADKEVADAGKEVVTEEAAKD